MAFSLRNISTAIESMSARERMLAAIMGAISALCVILIGSILIYNKLDNLEERNDAMRTALRDLERKKAQYLQARQKISDLEGKIGTVPLQLPGYIEQAQKEASIDIRETSSRPAEPIGKRYIQQSMDLRLSRVQLEPLARFMRRLEQAPGNLVMVTQLAIRARDDKHIDFDADMTVSTFEHAPKKQKAKPADEGKGAKDDN